MDHSNHGDDSKSSSNDVNDQRSEKTGVTPSSGRSYECVFCKRGFTTAQALGGHMNIHRKRRSKTSKAEGNNPVFRSNHHVSQTSTSHPPMDSKLLMDDDDDEEHGFRYPSIHGKEGPHRLNHIRDDRSSSEVGSFDRNNEEDQKRDQGSTKKVELDLELRL